MLQLPDGNYLMHDGVPYDPVKAHDYYEKHKKLKGRKRGSTEQSVARVVGGPMKPTPPRPQKVAGGGSYMVSFNGKTYKLTPKELAEQKAYAAVRVARIKNKVTKLEGALREKMAEARKKERESKKPDTAAEKRDQAKDSEKYRDKHQQELKTKAKTAAKKADTKPDLNTVEGLQKTIEGVQTTLRQAVERQRALSTATRG